MVLGGVVVFKVLRGAFWRGSRDGLGVRWERGWFQIAGCNERCAVEITLLCMLAKVGRLGRSPVALGSGVELCCEWT